MILNAALLLVAATAVAPAPFDACALLPVEKVSAIVGVSFSAKSKFDADAGNGSCFYSPPTPGALGVLDQHVVNLSVLTDASIAPTKYLRYHNAREYFDVRSRDPIGTKAVSGVGDAAVDVTSGGRWILKGTTVFQVTYRAPVTRKVSLEQRDAIIRKLEAEILANLSH